MDRDLVERVNAWREFVLNTRVGAMSEGVEGSWKWISREYAEHKLGIY